MNIYRFISVGYDLLDKIWLSEKGVDPREVIKRIIPDKKCRILDMCCGTFSNGISVAKSKPESLVIGLDRSRPMLREGKRKVKGAGLKNVKLLCRDAAKTGFKSGVFDYVIIGLVLHECTPELWDGILNEAHRVLKNNGHLIILDWEMQHKIGKVLKFAPLRLAEVLNNPKYFNEFYRCDKRRFFDRFGFKTERYIRCNYTAVLSLVRK